ncbi:hypothetical protein WISP_146122 [Willisornis vidua]|uniref:Neurobeachin n=1 Tax=Willisornis vidua TaxID=1566151 RepID=A0ABQ9CQX6_9PASS|nr:hypothetical protein WISP_146122 [Willisornis vidua]
MASEKPVSGPDPQPAGLISVGAGGGGGGGGGSGSGVAVMGELRASGSGSVVLPAGMINPSVPIRNIRMKFAVLIGLIQVGEVSNRDIVETVLNLLEFPRIFDFEFCTVDSLAVCNKRAEEWSDDSMAWWAPDVQLRISLVLWLMKVSCWQPSDVMVLGEEHWVTLSCPKVRISYYGSLSSQGSGYRSVRGWCCGHFPGKPIPMPSHLLGEKPFPDIQPKPPLTQLHAIPSSPISGHESEEFGACPSASPREDVEDHNKVSPRSPLLQAEQTK